ncbi:sigma-70 family RNA polymerase sigma factor [Jannaschia aquimarina]|uniref:SigW protein n=1 Tax=Jannaschia aquimarina TaxID=935700 RepID=A0A0D1EJ02_9RHOB|nr:sigma-70 family RNA polymerase sigma factor [Jannaschia aquimarina]KIT16916.1 ECF RNA polymerase sigma factor SigW [Jannaschia aquimarina]SNT11678.1 RNA polymerase, sigma subunit, ECF family [Jannaschia aquimarina]
MRVQDDRRDEAGLLAAAGRGDRRAARALVDRLGPRLMGFVLRMTGGDRAAAEDIVQEAFLRLWARSGDWDADGAAGLGTWLGRVAANLAIDRSRRRRDAPLDQAPPIADPAPGGEGRMQQAARHDAVYTALASLPERQRQAVVLRHIEGYANPEIAAMMGIGVEAVESLTARGKRGLAALLRPRQEEL